MDIADTLALHDLLAEHWARVDRVVEPLAADLYTDDATIDIGALTRSGADDIRAYYLERRVLKDETGRYTRHAMTNVQVIAGRDGHAELRFLCTVFAGRGAMPFASAPPSNIADFSASCRKAEDGRWQIAAITGRAIFAGPEAHAHAR